MAQYNYKARNQRGQIFAGVVDAVSEEEAVNLLKDKNLEIVFLEYSADSPEKKSSGSGFTLFKKRVKRKEIVILVRQLAVMISANLTLVQALRIIVQQVDNSTLKQVMTDVATEVEGGVKFSDALAKHDKVFSTFFASMIKSGETSGKLDEVLEYLADQEERDYDLVSKIKGAMIYPIFIICGLFVVGVAMMIFVIPQLTGMLQGSGATLPASTRILIFISDTLRNYWWALIIAIVGLIALFKVVLKNPQGKRAWDLFKLKLPIFGKLFQMIYLVRLTQSLSTLIKGGVTLPDSLRIVSEIVGNVVYKEIIDQTVKEVEDGNSVALIFGQSPLVPRLISQMLSVGEKTGQLDTILDKINSFYSREIENMVANMTHLMEPLIMVVIGVAVGGMVASIIMPMYQLANQF
jgi:type IV pilus assembly protein PilC